MSTESFAAYRVRVLGYLGQHDPIAVLVRTPARLESVIRSRSRAVMGKKPAPDKWSAIEILAHLADAELAFGWRLRTLLAEKSARLTAFDQNVWADVGQYSGRSPARALLLFRLLRESNLALLRATPRGEWSAHAAMHDLRGRITLADLVQLEAAHDLNHLRQLTRLLGPAKRGLP